MILLNGGVRTFIQVFAIKLIQEVIVDVYLFFQTRFNYFSMENNTVHTRFRILSLYVLFSSDPM